MPRSKFTLPRVGPWAPDGMESFALQLDRVFIRLEDVLRQFEARAVADGGISQAAVTQHQSALALSASQIVSGTFANARIAAGNVTQHEGAIDHDALLNYRAEEHIDWTIPAAPAVIDPSNLPPLEKEFSVQAVGPADDVVAGDVHMVLIGESYRLVGAIASHYIPSSGSDDTVVNLRRVRGGVEEDMLSSPLVIEGGSVADDGTAEVDEDFWGLQLGDLIVVEVVDAPTPPAQGLALVLYFAPGGA